MTIWNQRTFRFANLAGVVAALALGAAAGAWPARSAAVRGASWGWTLVLGGSVGLLTWKFGHRQFGGFDHSVLIDLGWRMACGQHPYADFPTTVPVGFLLGIRHAFQLFGVRWSAIILWQAAFAMITCVWSFALLLRIGLSPGVGALIAFAIQASTSLTASYWWYNPATAVAGVVFVLSALCWRRAPHDRLALASYTLSLAMLGGMKPNVAGLLIVGVTATMLGSPPHRNRVAIASLAAGVTLTAWLAVEGIWLPDVLASYVSIADRAVSTSQFLADATPNERSASVALLCLLLVPLVWVFAGPSRRLPGSLVGVTAVIAGVSGFIQNGECKVVDMALLLVAHLAFVAPGRPIGPHQALSTGGGTTRTQFAARHIRYVIAMAAVLSVAGVTVGATRSRVRSIAPRAFFEYDLSIQSPKTGFFSNLAVGPQFITVEAQVAALLDEKPGASVFFGPRMQWAYAAFHRPSPLGEPVWWHRGVAYADDARVEAAAVDSWARAHADLLVFLRRDFTYLPDGMLLIMRRDYDQRQGFPALSVYERRKSQ